MPDRKMVMVTRPLVQAQSWVEAMCQRGWDAHALPTIEIVSSPDPAAVSHTWQKMDQWNAVMFVSSNAVEHFFALQPLQYDVAIIGQHPRWWVVGPGSFQILAQQKGVNTQLIDCPEQNTAQFDSEALWSRVRGQIYPGFQVLIVRGAGGGRDWLAQQLCEAGAVVTTLAAYQRICPDFDSMQRTKAQKATQQGAVWVFSSAEAIQNLCRGFAECNWHDCCAIVTHPRIARAAQEAGFGLVHHSRPLLNDVLACLDSLR